MIGFVKEVITHFSCGECGKWFSICEYDVMKDKSVICAHCGHATIPIAMKSGGG